MVYAFLVTFWVSVYLIFSKPREKITQQIDYYSEYLLDMARSSKVAKGYVKLQTERKKKQLMSELVDGLSYLKNITILGRGENISAEYMLEELSDFSPGLSKTYLDMARSISLNEKIFARDALFKVTGNAYARDIGAFLVSWEDIPPTELLSSIEAYLNVIREEQVTKQKAKDELVSDLAYLPVVFNCMLVLLNFIFVSYFIEQEEVLGMMFTF